MRKFNSKIISNLIAIVLLLSVLPLGTAAQNMPEIYDEQSLIKAIDNISLGGSGEINLSTNIYLNQTLVIEGKSVVLNMKNNAAIFTIDKTVISVIDGNLTINSDGSSQIRVAGATEWAGNTNAQGLITVANSNYNGVCTLTVNGGNYNTYFAGDCAISASSKTKVIVDDAYVNGAIKTDGSPKGEIVINGGVFNTDISQFVKDKWCGKVYETWYVREKEYSAEFVKVFPENKITFNFTTPKSYDDLDVVLSDYYSQPHEAEIFFLAGGFSDDFLKCDVSLMHSNGLDEIHTIDVVWNFDSKVSEKANSFIEKFPEDREWFNITDLEVINYFYNGGLELEDGIDTLANYSSELKGYLNNTNFSLEVEAAAGDDQPFLTERIGIAKLVYKGIVYFTDADLGAKAEHIIYVPSATGDGKEDILAAAQKRIDDYMGEGKVKVTYKETLAEYKAKIVADAQAVIAEKKSLYENYADTHRNDQLIIELSNEINNSLSPQIIELENRKIPYQQKLDEYNSQPDPNIFAIEIAEAKAEISHLNEWIAEIQQKITDKYALIHAEQDKPIFNYGEYQELESALNTAQSNIERYAAGDFADNDELAFLNDAEGGYIFNVEIGEKVYNFITKKNDAKLTVPTYASVDLNTNVEVKTDSSEIPLDTAVEVEKLTSGTEYDKIIKAIGIEDGETFDIKLHSNSLGEYITKLENGKFQVKLPIPERFEGKQLVVYYVDANNKVTEHTVTVKDGYAIFTTDHFSVYTLSELIGDLKNPANPTNPDSLSPETNDNGSMALWLAILAMSVIALIGVYKFKKVR